MARTDKTRPWHVRVSEDPMRTCRPRHDHRDGPCDLPADPRAADGHLTRCRWAETAEVLYGRGGGCGCGWCTGRTWRRTERRRQRHAARRDAHAHRRAAHRGTIEPA